MFPDSASTKMTVALSQLGWFILAIGLGSLSLILTGCNEEKVISGTTFPEFAPEKLNPPQTAILEPPIKRIQEIKETDCLKDEDLVLGVGLNGDFRAYPINQMIGPKRGVVNDFLGDQPILVGW